jgi:methylmalonyl-CoA/ethylmalonyl-CoA epimerase
MQFHHIGIAVNDMDQAIQLYRQLGYSCSEVINDPIQNVNLCFLEKENSPLLELVAACSELSPVSTVLKKNGATPYHTCYEVEDIDEAIMNLKKQRFIPLGKPVPAVAFDGNRVVVMV